MGRVTGKVALVTGGARGLGFYIARKLAEEGARVVITDIDEATGIKAAESISQSAGPCGFMTHNVCVESEWDVVIKSILKDYGSLHILVNNAGIAGAGSIEELSFETWRKTMAVNLDSVFLGTQKAVEVMKSSGGSVINISSIKGLVGNPGIAAYNASKGGVRLLSKSAALYCAEQDYPVRVNSVHPGYVLTEMVRNGLDALGPQAWDEVLGSIPVKKMGEPDDVAYGVLYLASDESKYVTGSELVIDGGFTAK
jgi:3(or 17)beta-hydroxysteroid dehydrogenase